MLRCSSRVSCAGDGAPGGVEIVIVDSCGKCPIGELRTVTSFVVDPGRRFLQSEVEQHFAAGQ